MAPEELGPGSEGDAYRYTKKVLLSLPNAPELRQIYTEIARNRNISSWTRACYQELRTQFFRDGQCKVKFAPGVARIAYGELDFGTGDEDFRKLADLRDYVRIISIAHFTEYTRHLSVDGKALTFADLTETYGSTAADNWRELKSELRKIHYGPRRYRIIWLDTFETARQYYEYTKPHGWCHLDSRSMFETYSFSRATGLDGSSKVCPVKLYLAVLPGFETMAEDDPLYGESMLGIDIGPGGRLIHVNNRWNHAHDNIDQRKGDNKYSERELSELMGAPFYTLCPPMTKRDEARIVSRMRRNILDANRDARAAARQIARDITRLARRKSPIPPSPMVNVVEPSVCPATVLATREAVEKLRRHEGNCRRPEDLPPDVPGEDVIEGSPYDTYTPVTAVRVAGETRLFLDSAVAPVHAGPDLDAEYEAECSDYVGWRSSLIGEGTPVADPEDIELISPMGFGRSGVPREEVAGANVPVLAGTCAGRHFAAYIPAAALRSLPEGCRLPTLAEFVAMLISRGGSAGFGVEFGVGVAKMNSDGSVLVSPGMPAAEMRAALERGLYCDGKPRHVTVPTFLTEEDTEPGGIAVDLEADFRKGLPAKARLVMPVVRPGTGKDIGLEIPQDPRADRFGILLSLGVPGNPFRADTDSSDGEAGDGRLVVATYAGGAFRFEVLGNYMRRRHCLVYPVRK
jgi:hypothetical protein